VIQARLKTSDSPDHSKLGGGWGCSRGKQVSRDSEKKKRLPLLMGIARDVGCASKCLPFRHIKRNPPQWGGGGASK